ncbi:MAG TPA: hypothetical protein DD740_04450 [Chryseobacterium sp.]|nr:hypothetical protein [Chryseobacterium sp.]
MGFFFCFFFIQFFLCRFRNRCKAVLFSLDGNGINFRHHTFRSGAGTERIYDCCIVSYTGCSIQMVGIILCRTFLGTGQCCGRND